ncbi:hypothetical protein CBR_g17077 [Chara braunii]|uniref:Uncharacterized protein n=1 Tax=Chara braunii TaxID=69332 RepID=A0A388KUK8_CHABU|nr:hypothetical protein CBR_g17077 [Chara braunii]|eukprot:GBG73737.1 hypothetical protein CBR_g17077 [Chara braunii]
MVEMNEVREARSPPTPEQSMKGDKYRIRDLTRLCYEEGIFTGSIDPGEMTVNGREATFRVNTRIDQTKVQWLNDHMVTMIFREGVQFLPKKIKDDAVRAYEDDDRLQDGTFEATTFRRGRVKVESPDVVSYVAKSTQVKDWLMMKGRYEVMLCMIRYVLEFKRWLTQTQLREQRRREEEANFSVVVVQVPLGAMLYLEAQVSKAVGLVIRVNSLEPDWQKQSLINLKFDVEPSARQNMKEKISVVTFEGDTLTVNIASSETPRCRRCRAFFHEETQCKRNTQTKQGHKADKETLKERREGSQSTQGPYDQANKQWNQNRVQQEAFKNMEQQTVTTTRRIHQSGEEVQYRVRWAKPGMYRYNLSPRRSDHGRCRSERTSSLHKEDMEIQCRISFRKTDLDSSQVEVALLVMVDPMGVMEGTPGRWNWRWQPKRRRIQRHRSIRQLRRGRTWEWRPARWERNDNNNKWSECRSIENSVVKIELRKRR